MARSLIAIEGVTIEPLRDKSSRENSLEQPKLGFINQIFFEQKLSPYSKKTLGLERKLC